MASPTSHSTPSLQVRRVFKAPREKVFAAWTKREQLEHWMCRPDPRNVVKYLEFDFREGGKYLLENRIANGEVFMNRGIYRVIQSPEKLVWVWGWEHFDQAGKKIGELDGTIVTVEFHDLGNSTEVVLTHELFPTPEMRDLHQKGWNGCFDMLAEYLGV